LDRKHNKNKNRMFDLIIKKPLIYIFVLVILLSGMSVFMSGCRNEGEKTVKIGVLMPLTGPDAMESEKTLDWAMEKVNSGGGIGGSPVELVYRDTNNQDISLLAQQFIDDPDINIVIGPYRSADVFLVAPLFIENRKILISPTATAGEITRGFGGQDYFWRTVQSDVAQIRCILAELASRNVKKFSLVYVDTSYGQTFYQWAGFFATELGMELTNMVSYDQTSDFDAVMDQALSGNPEYIVTAAYADAAVKFKRIIDSRKTSARLFFTDAVETPFVLSELGSQAEGIELMTPAADPDSGFEKEFKEVIGYMPFDTAAAHYDAFLLAVCTLARQKSMKSLNPFRHNESLADSLRVVSSGTDKELNWDQISEAVKMIFDKKIPHIAGASGHIEFDKKNGVDPIQTFYSLNRVETRGDVFDFWTIRRFSSDETLNVGLLQEQTSAVFTRAGKQALTLQQDTALFTPQERKDLWAVIACTSSGWKNYRHQADALAMYNLLKKNGVSDDRIIFLTEDDMPWLKENPLKGNIHHKVKGPNLRKSAEIDYTGSEVNLDNLKNILLGITGADTPEVLDSTKNSNVFLYMVDHGAVGKLPFFNGEPLLSENLASIVNEMNEKEKYRQMFIMVEACFGESIGQQINSPGVLFFTGASKSEASFGAVYDNKIKQWLADDFTSNVIGSITADPGISINDLYLKTYDAVAGSHVQLVNYKNFGDMNTPISDFIMP